jgi:hypothetical protein
MEAKFSFEAVIYNSEGKVREVNSREAATAETPTAVGNQQQQGRQKQQ